MRKLIASFVLIGILLGAVLLAIPHPCEIFSLITADEPSALPVPVQGVLPSAIADTWGSPRGSDREHKASIFSPNAARRCWRQFGCWSWT